MRAPPSDGSVPRLAELLAALSLVTDLARGHPPEEAMRACVLAIELARHMGVRDPDLGHVYYTTLLRFVCCTATSHEYAVASGGDDVAVRARGDLTDPTRPAEAIRLLFDLTAGTHGVRRIGRLAASLRIARRTTAEGGRADCEVGARMARRFELEEDVERALFEVFERWDGRGGPGRRRGEAIALPARFATVAFVAVMFESVGGRAAAGEAVGRWSGGALDPSIAQAYLASAAEIGDGIALQDPWEAVLEAEPGPRRTVTERRFDEVARGFADLVDLKSPYLHGHSSAVAALAEAAGRSLGVAEEDAVACAGQVCCTTSAAPASRPGSGRSRARCRSRNGSRSGCTATIRSGSSRARRRSRPSLASQARITNGSTVPAITAACPPGCSTSLRACSPPPTSSRR